MRISRNYRDKHWKALKFDTEEDRKKGIDIFMDRMETRYLVHIRRMLSHTTSGFAALALDCIVIETMEQFRQGTRKTPYKKAEAYFGSFLTDTSFSAYVTEHQARLFYTQIRCGLLHQSEVEGSLIKRDDTRPLISTTKEAINEYAYVLKQPESSVQRAAFRKKMNFICAVEEVPQ